MSRARLVITAVVIEGRSQAEVARAYGVSKSWVSKLIARYKREGETAFEPRSRKPNRSPNRINDELIDAIVSQRKSLKRHGLDAGPDTIAWHLLNDLNMKVSPATVSRYLTRAGLVTPQPLKRPRASYVRFEALMPNETWQSDFTHIRLTNGTDAKALTWLDDCTRRALSLTAHTDITAQIVLTTFRNTITQYGAPASTLTDNGMVYTARFATGKGGRTALENELHTLGITQKNSRPNHPTTCGKVERFQQTLKQWLAARPAADSIEALQELLDTFKHTYNQHRPHRSLPHKATPQSLYDSLPKAQPGDRTDTHDRVRHDRIDKTGLVTLRHNGRLHHIGIGAAHAGTRVVLLVQNLHIRVIAKETGELLRQLTLNPNRDYQPTGKPPGPPKGSPRRGKWKRAEP